MTYMRKKSGKEVDQRDMLSAAFAGFDAKLAEIEAEERAESERTIFEGIKELRREYTDEIAGSTHFLAALQFIEREKATFIPTAMEKPRFRGKSEFHEKLSHDLLRFAEISPIRLWGIERLCETFLDFHPLKDLECSDVESSLELLVSGQAIPNPVIISSVRIFVISRGGLTELQNSLLRQIAGADGSTSVSELALLTGLQEPEILVAIDTLVEKDILVLTAESEIYLPSAYA